MADLKLWHCHSSRSLRPLWTLEEMGLDYELVLLPFPPRMFQKEYLGTNVLGTIPYFEDRTGGADINMTESSAICSYLTERHGHVAKSDLSIPKDHHDYGDYLNWLYHSDATLLFPQTIVMRYTHLEPPERKLPQAVEDYGQWYIARLRRLDAHLADGKQFLCADKFSIADICIAYSLYFGDALGLSEHYQPQTLDYMQRMVARPAFEKIKPLGADLNPFADLLTKS